MLTHRDVDLLVSCSLMSLCPVECERSELSYCLSCLSSLLAPHSLQSHIRPLSFACSPHFPSFSTITYLSHSPSFLLHATASHWSPSCCPLSLVSSFFPSCSLHLTSIPPTFLRHSCCQEIFTWSRGLKAPLLHSATTDERRNHLCFRKWYQAWETSSQDLIHFAAPFFRCPASRLPDQVS